MGLARTLGKSLRVGCSDQGLAHSAYPLNGRYYRVGQGRVYAVCCGDVKGTSHKQTTYQELQLRLIHRIPGAVLGGRQPTEAA